MSGKLRIAGVVLIAAKYFCGLPAVVAQDAPPGQVSAQASTGSVLETQWDLVELDGERVAPADSHSQPYIYLQQQGDRLSGSAGCNRLFGSFDLNESSLQFHSVASTRMACAGDSMAHESALFEALKLTTSYQISGNTLQLRVEDRVLARFQAEKKK